MALFLTILPAEPPAVLAQDNTSATEKRFSQEELDQILAPVALYPDSLLAQVLMASTYPLEVVMADRWIAQNKNLTGDNLIEAANKQPWDPSVSALVAFPDLLSTMAEKLEWTEKLGDAFLAQESDVMETVQTLRKRAYEVGNLKSTDEQHVIVEKETIVIEPADPKIVYVPVYDSGLVYGSWWWPYYPPYVVFSYSYPSPVYYSGYIGFSSGFVVGAYWGNWGYCNWPYRTVYVNSHYHKRPHPRYPRASVGGVFESGGRHTVHKWIHDPYHRRGVAYRNAAVGKQFGKNSRASAPNRRSSHNFERKMAGMAADMKAEEARRSSRTGRGGRNVGRTYTSIDRRGKAEVSAHQPGHTLAERATKSNKAGKTSPTVEGTRRTEKLSTHRRGIEQGESTSQTTERVHRRLSARGGSPSARADGSREILNPKSGMVRQGRIISASKAANLSGAPGVQGSAGRAISGRGSVGGGGSKLGEWSRGGDGRGGRGGHSGKGVGGGKSRGGR